ncbi:MAG: radical SAM protein [Dehalococcoidia bacterium]
MTDQQLDLFVSTAPPAERPERLGPARVDYVDSKSVLTPASGFMENYDFTLNPYSGCGFGCEYCYARFFAPTEELRDTWGEWVKVKENAIEALRKAMRSRGSHRLDAGAKIYMSSVTDPYQPVEKKLELTRRILEVLLDVQPRLTIQTRSPLATRDIDLFKKFERIRVNFTIPTDSEAVRLRYEPHCPSIDVRFNAAAEVSRAGIPIGISISPTLPVYDAEEFGCRLAALDAAEYVTQFMKPPTMRFRAGSAPEALAKMHEDAWTVDRYKEARACIQRQLGVGRPLLEGISGYAPPQ